jgi:hypothetical protein
MRKEIICTRVHRSEEIAFYSHVMDLLGKPVNLNFWWGEKERVLAVSAAAEPTETSVPAPRYFYTRPHGPKIRNKRLLQAINRKLGKPDDSMLKLFGEYVPEINMVVFKVCSVAELEAAANE